VDEGRDRRRAARLSTSGGPYGVSFRQEGRDSRQVRLANISSTGCALEIPMEEAWDMEMGSVFRDFYLNHPELPFVPLHATVVRLLGKVPGKTSGYILAGVDFTLITPLVQGLIQAHVEAHLLAEEG